MSDHDPLCPGYHPEGRSRTPDDCWKCALIERVREDERLTMEAIIDEERERILAGVNGYKASTPPEDWMREFFIQVIRQEE